MIIQYVGTYKTTKVRHAILIFLDVTTHWDMQKLYQYT